MSAHQRSKARNARILWAIGAAACVFGATTESRAQGFFDGLFGGFEERPAASARPAAPARRAPPAPAAAQSWDSWGGPDERSRSWNWFGGEQPAVRRAPQQAARPVRRPARAALTVRRPVRAEAADDAADRAPRRERRVASGGGGDGGSQFFCVRLCDGRYFPLSQALSGDTEEALSTCNSLCPAAKTKVFRGSEAEDARASDGTRYRELPVAFAFRERIVADCSCTGRGPGGLAAMKLESDPTLQPGDLAMTRTGLMAFKGASRTPYRTADFTPVGSYARLSADLRRTLARVKPDTNAAQLPPIIPVVAATEDAAGKKGKKNRARAQRGTERQARVDD